MLTLFGCQGEEGRAGQRRAGQGGAGMRRASGPGLAGPMAGLAGQSLSGPCKTIESTMCLHRAATGVEAVTPEETRTGGAEERARSCRLRGESTRLTDTGHLILI